MVKGMKFATVWFLHLSSYKALLSKLGSLLARNDVVPLPEPSKMQSTLSYKRQFLPV